MRNPPLMAVMLSVAAACYVGPLDVDTVGTTDSSDTTTSEGSASTSASTSITSSTTSAGTTATTAAETGTATTDPGESSSDPTANDSSSGGMSGCESGPLPTPIPGCTPIAAASSGD